MSNQEHNRPAGPRLEPIIQGRSPSHAEWGRGLVAQSTHGTLCTIALQPAGYPYGSMVAYALDDQGQPTFLISDMAEHTANLKNDPRSSLLVTEGGSEDRLALGRITLLGKARRLQGESLPDARARYLERHPNARNYVDFKDFHFYRLEVEAIRYIGGFGRMSWVEPDEYRSASVDPIEKIAAGILEHMNEDHAASLVLFCQHFAGLQDTVKAVMTSVDRYGFEMSATTPEGPRFVRLGFPEVVESPDSVRQAMIAMVGQARKSKS